MGIIVSGALLSMVPALVMSIKEASLVLVARNEDQTSESGAETGMSGVIGMGANMNAVGGLRMQGVDGWLGEGVLRFEETIDM